MNAVLLIRVVIIRPMQKGVEGEVLGKNLPVCLGCTLIIGVLALVLLTVF